MEDADQDNFTVFEVQSPSSLTFSGLVGAAINILYEIEVDSTTQLKTANANYSYFSIQKTNNLDVIYIYIYIRKLKGAN